MTTLEGHTERPPRLRRTRKAINIVTWTVLCVFIAGIGVLGVYVRTGHAQVTPILSGSMEPYLMTGDAALVHKVPVSSLKVGDIVIFHPPTAKPGDPPKVHRIVYLKHLSANKIEFRTKGDNNSIADPWGAVTMSGTAFKVVYDIPYAGWLINVKGQWIAIALLMLLAGLIARWSVNYLRSPDSERTTTPDQTGQDPQWEETP